MGRIHHEIAYNHVSSPVHRQTHSCDVLAETIPTEWHTMQKSETREGYAWNDAIELRSEEQKSDRRHWTSQTRKTIDCLHRRNSVFETINQTPWVVEEKQQSDRESGRRLRWFPFSDGSHDGRTRDWIDQDPWKCMHRRRLSWLSQITSWKSGKKTCLSVHGQRFYPQEALRQRVVAKIEHGADLEHRVQSWIPAYWSCVLESEKAVQQPAAEQPCEQDGVQRRQRDWRGVQVDNSWALPFMCEEELIFVKTCFLTRLNMINNSICSFYLL